MGSHANPHLAAAVANAGGLGMVSVYGGYGGPPEHVAAMLDATRQRTTGVFGANFIIQDADPVWTREAAQVAAAHANDVDAFDTPAPTPLQSPHFAPRRRLLRLAFISLNVPDCLPGLHRSTGGEK